MAIFANRGSEMDMEISKETETAVEACLMATDPVENLECMSEDDASSSSSDTSLLSEGEEDLGIDFEDVSDSEIISNHIPKTKNELSEIPEEILAVPETIDSACPLMSVGKIFAIVENQIIIQSCNNFAILDLDNLLILEDRRVLGKVFDTFGPIEAPFYSVIKKEGMAVSIGDGVFTISDAFSAVKTAELRKEKGCDASNMYDEEVDRNEIEYSEDEKEMQQKRNRKHKQKSKLGKDSVALDPFAYTPLERPEVDDTPSELPSILPPLPKSSSSLGRGRRPQNPKNEVLVNESTVYFPSQN